MSQAINDVPKVEYNTSVCDYDLEYGQSHHYAALYIVVTSWKKTLIYRICKVRAFNSLPRSKRSACVSDRGRDEGRLQEHVLHIHVERV
jgi:hypothetical protein